MSLSGASNTMSGPRMIFRVIALFSERSGRFEIHRAYAWAKDQYEARKMAERTYRGAKHIVVKKRVD